MSTIKPNKLNILGIDHAIRYRRAEETVTEEGNWGSFSAVENTIDIHYNDSDFKRWHILFHEILHAIGEAYNLRMDRDEDLHQELHLIAHGITDVLIRNKLLKENKDGK